MNQSTRVVHKYGGTSVANRQRLQQAADIVVAARRSGQLPIVVVSAMRGGDVQPGGVTTDSLLSMALSYAGASDADTLYDSDSRGREADALAALGEMMTAPLLALILQRKGVDAVSLNAFQAGLSVDDRYGHATITGVRTERIEQALAQGQVPVLPGFQGLNERTGAILTLGRGCSDTSSIAVAAALKAEECMIYTDVEGVFPVDPKEFKGTRPLAQVTFAEMAELAYDGAPVLHARAVDMAWQEKIPLRIRSTFAPEQPGTLVTAEL